MIHITPLVVRQTLLCALWLHSLLWSSALFTYARTRNLWQQSKRVLLILLVTDEGLGSATSTSSGGQCSMGTRHANTIRK